MRNQRKGKQVHGAASPLLAFPVEKIALGGEARKVDQRPLVTHAFPLGEAQEAMVFAQQPGVMKVLLKA